MPDIGCFSDYVHKLGVHKDSHVIVYDRGSMVAAARAWWTFRAFGHEFVSVLDGGLYQWEQGGFPTDAGDEAKPVIQGNFEPRLQPDLVRKFEDMIVNIKTQSDQVVDARNHEDFIGNDSEPSQYTRKAFESMGMAPPSPGTMLGGHIPGAININEDLFIDKDTKCLLSRDKLEEVFTERGVDISKPLTTMCYNGNAASLVALAAAVCGHRQTSLYYGSWTEFGLRAEQLHVRSMKNSPSKKSGG